MKTITFLKVCSTLSLVLVCARASESAAESKRVSHYAAPDITTVAEARSAFSKTLESISKIVDDRDTSMAELEQVHQLSYTLESALEFLVKDSPSQKFAPLQAAVEELHLASEKHEAETSFIALDKIQNLKGATQSE